MARELVQTRADADTVESLEAYAEEADISRSEAIRRLLRTGLAEHGHGVAAADGSGQLADRLDQLEAEQEQANRLHTAALLTGVLYIVATITLDLSGPIWLLSGIGTIATIIFATKYRNQHDE
jgi:hypothetical protein